MNKQYDIEQTEIEARDLYDDHMNRMAEDHLIQSEHIAHLANPKSQTDLLVERLKEIALWHAQIQVEFDRELLGLKPEPF